MIDLAIEKKEKVKLSWRASVHEEFVSFLNWAKSHEDKADESNVLEFVLKASFDGRSSEMRAFAEWRDAKQTDETDNEEPVRTTRVAAAVGETEKEEPEQDSAVDEERARAKAKAKELLAKRRASATEK